MAYTTLIDLSPENLATAANAVLKARGTHELYQYWYFGDDEIQMHGGFGGVTVSVVEPSAVVLDANWNNQAEDWDIKRHAPGDWQRHLLHLYVDTL